jgi:hypothetical protein
VNGLLYDVGDVEGMARGAIDLLHDDARLTSMATAARKTAQDHFCASGIITKYEEYYRRVLRGDER